MVQTSTGGSTFVSRCFSQRKRSKIDFFFALFRKFCVDKYGVQIGNYSLPKGDPEADNMNCRQYLPYTTHGTVPFTFQISFIFLECARANLLTSDSNICCRNGNYPKVNRFTKRSRKFPSFFFLILFHFFLSIQQVACKNDECYCLDENGNQMSAEVQVEEISILSCYNDGIFC